MEKQCASLATLVGDLLDLARSASGPIQATAVDLTAVVEQALQVLEISGGDQVRQRVTLEALPRAFGDPGLLRQVFVNLIGNGLKFGTADRQPSVRVGAHVAGSMLCVEVSDTGIGFDAARADQLFTPFARLHSGGPAGTGIGLTVVKRIVERHGGQVSARSEPGRGATFGFTLPLAPEPRESA
jgi:signal transduction histidine kinase